MVMAHDDVGRRPTPHDANERRLVRLPDGRTARLLYAPRLNSRRVTAKVLVDGRHVLVNVDELEVVGQ